MELFVPNDMEMEMGDEGARVAVLEAEVSDLKGKVGALLQLVENLVSAASNANPMVKMMLKAQGINLDDLVG